MSHTPSPPSSPPSMPPPPPPVSPPPVSPPSPSTAPPPCPFCAISTAYPPSGIPPPSSSSTTTPSSPSSTHSSPTTTTDPPPSSLLPSPYPTSTSTATTAPAHLILSTPHCLAFLDHAPLARGHTLLCVRSHRIKACDLSIGEGASLGRWLGVLGRAVTGAVAEVIAAEERERERKRRRQLQLQLQGKDEEDEEEEEEGEGEEEEEGVVGDWNIVQNNGVRAAQVVPHVHYHVIPRVVDSGGAPDDVAKVKSWTVFGKGQREELDEGDAAVLVERIRERLGAEVERVRRREGEGSVEQLFGGVDEGGEEGWERRWSKL